MNTVKILFVTAEMPFSKAGGLADVSGSLPVALKALNCDIRIITPFYKMIKDKIEISVKNYSKFNLEGLKITKEVRIHLFNYENIPTYLLDIPDYFFRKGIYTDDSGKGYLDNHERFGVFSWAVLQFILKIKWAPDIIHINDWHTGFIPVWRKINLFREQEKLQNIKILLTIHNLVYQGDFHPKDIEDFISINQTIENDFFIYEKLNPLKAGIVSSDLITTVSPSYALEIQTIEHGAGLENILKDRSNSLFGILNGININEWNPSTDSLIPHNYTINDISGKITCKEKLLEKLTLPVNTNIALIGNISRITHQKGFDIIIPALEQLLPELNFYFVIFGAGNRDFEERLKLLESSYPQRVSVNIEYNNVMAHWVEAGSDFFLMPSYYEPCGLNQMFSMRYGTIPIVRETGGLKDTVIDLRTNPKIGSGYLFKDYKVELLVKTVRDVIKWFYETDKPILNHIQERIMKIDFSWENSAREYYNLYQKYLRK